MAAVTRCGCGRQLRGDNKRVRCATCRRLGRNFPRSNGRVYRASTPARMPQERRSGVTATQRLALLSIDDDVAACDEAGLISALLDREHEFNYFEVGE